MVTVTRKEQVEVLECAAVEISAYILTHRESLAEVGYALDFQRLAVEPLPVSAVSSGLVALIVKHKTAVKQVMPDADEFQLAFGIALAAVTLVIKGGKDENDNSQTDD